MTYECTLCKKIVDFNNIEDIQLDKNDTCPHNWVLKRDAEDYGEDLFKENKTFDTNEAVENIINEVSTYDIIPVDKLHHKITNDFKVGVDYYNELNTDMEKIYNEIRQKHHINLTLPEFREMMESITTYDNKSKEFMNILTSKIIDKYTTLSLSKTAIGVSKLIDNLVANLLEKSNNMEEDEIGFENNRMVQVGFKTINEYLKIVKELRQYMSPDPDRKLDDMSKTEEESDNIIDLSNDDIKTLVNKFRIDDSKKN